jgi:uncharacterized membrane protein YheB (UPF0754 family)
MPLSQILTLILVPMAVATAHGFFTNWMAVQLLLKPVKPVNILGFKLQGLLPRRQEELAERISAAIAERFLTREDILNFLRQVDPVSAMRALLVEKWEEKLGEILDSIPMARMFVNPERLEGIRDKLAGALAEEAGTFTERLVDSLEGKIDLKETLRRNILAFDVTELNGIIEQIGYREFREIAWVGAGIGLMIGSAHAVINVLFLR